MVAATADTGQQSPESASDFRPLSTLTIGVTFFALQAVWLVMGIWARGFHPTDFVVFHGAGNLFADGRSETAYNGESFQEYLASEYGAAFEPSALAQFLNPPPFGWFAQVLGLLPLTPSLVVFSIVNVVVAIAVFRHLELPSKALVLLLLNPIMVANVSLGQTGSLALLATVAIHTNMVRDRRLVAGLIAGAFLLKPPLAVGYGLLWLIQARRYAGAIAIAFGTGAVLSIPTVLGGFDPWRSFITNAVERTSDDQRIFGRSYSFAEFVKPFWHEAPTSVTLVIWAIGLGLGGAMLVAVKRRFDGDIETLSAAASVVTVLFSPHVLLYDSLILVIPVAVLYRRGVLNYERAGALTLIMAVGTLIRFLPFATDPISFEFPALVSATALGAMWLAESSPDVASETPQRAQASL